MKIKDKINLETEGLIKHGPITIVAFGDSVTHGALDDGEFDYETVYWNRLKKKIYQKRDFVPVNVINAGISGISAEHSLPRLESQVLAHNPDLVIVCFGLNDVNGSLENYINSLRVIFEKCMQKGAEVIFMTPNTMNTYVAKDTLPQLVEYAGITANYQNNGKMDLFIEKAIELANEMGVKVCDCYSEWKKLAQTQDTTLLLTNRINHPKREMHELFASRLYEVIFSE
ncbi:MAG: GDSL family lipase [Clostridia bacterium]|nr:GDSL family lipase [Clostridia bacterium]